MGKTIEALIETHNGERTFFDGELIGAYFTTINLENLCDEYCKRQSVSPQATMDAVNATSELYGYVDTSYLGHDGYRLIYVDGTKPKKNIPLYTHPAPSNATSEQVVDVYKRITCDTCNGSGRYSRFECPDCSGKRGIYEKLEYAVYTHPAPSNAVNDALEQALHHYQEGVSASACAARIDGMYRGEVMSEQDYKSYTTMQQSVIKHANDIRALIKKGE